jgi:hypothetical protein
MIRQGRTFMDDLNMAKVKEWAVELGKKFNNMSEPLSLLIVVPLEYGFQFFTEGGINTGITARSTVEFTEKLQVIPIQSVEFHFQRQDFQRWFKNTIGDEELAKRIDQINIWVHDDEKLRKQLAETVQNHIAELKKS